MNWLTDTISEKHLTQNSLDKGLEVTAYDHKGTGNHGERTVENQE
jgi:hypothetical protein